MLLGRLPRNRHLRPVHDDHGIAEIVIGLALAATGLLHPGPGGLNLSGVNPANITSRSGFFLAVVLSIFAFTGFESAAAIGEESREPRRLIPAAIVGSVLMLGVFYVVTAWGLQIGWGTDHLTALANSPTAPAFVLASACGALAGSWSWWHC